VLPRFHFLFLLSMLSSSGVVKLMDCLRSRSSAMTWVFAKVYPGSTFQHNLLNSQKSRSAALITRFHFRYNLLICCLPVTILAAQTFREMRLTKAFVNEHRQSHSRVIASKDYSGSHVEPFYRRDLNPLEQETSVAAFSPPLVFTSICTSE